MKEFDHREVTMRLSIAVPRMSAPVLGLVLVACGGDRPQQPAEPPPGSTAAAIAFVSGDGQEGKAGEALPEPFVVRVTDDRGEGVEGVRVTWSVAAGAGDFPQDVSWRTRRDGIHRVVFRPTALGTSVVAAEVVGLEGSPVTFSTEASGVLIGFNYDPFGESWFAGPEGSSDVAVPVGTTVEWVVKWSPGGTATARIVSLSEPLGAEPFDSAVLTYAQRFQFIPGVPGTWEYVDQQSGATGTLTAR